MKAIKALRIGKRAKNIPAVRSLDVDDGLEPVVPVLKSEASAAYRRWFRKNYARQLLSSILISASSWSLFILFRKNLFWAIYPYLRPSGLLWPIILLLLVSYVSIVIHECGHLLAARLLKFRFLHFVAGPLMVERKRDGIHIRPIINIFAGQVLAMPIGAHHLARRDAWLYAGGPLANLLQAIVLATCSFWPGIAIYPALVLLLRVVAAIALLFTVINLIPVRFSNGSWSDGGGIVFLLKGGPRLARWRATTLLWMGLTESRLPREWDAALIAQAMTGPEETPEYIRAAYYGYYWMLDTGQIADARPVLERLLGARPYLAFQQKRWLALEAAYFEARYHHNAEAARRWLKQVKNTKADSCTKLRVEAAVLLAEGHKEQARSCINKGLEAAKDIFYAGSRRMEEVWLGELLALCEDVHDNTHPHHNSGALLR